MAAMLPPPGGPAIGRGEAVALRRVAQTPGDRLLPRE
jgi:hypothetical protein